MKCIGKKSALMMALLAFAVASSGCEKKAKDYVMEYETEHYQEPLFKSDLFAKDLCVVSEDVFSNSIHVSPSLHAVALLGVEEGEVFYSEHAHRRLYPASTTKILTAYLALKHGNLSDVVTVSHRAASVPSDSSVAGLREGDQLTLEDLLYGLMLPSGNDSAVAIAEHISGSTKEFVALMNEEARMLGATCSRFMNPHGYHDDNHYTTAYDLYLIFNQAVKNPDFIRIVSSDKYTATIKETDGTEREVTWRQSNMFVNGMRTVPDQVTVVGGKTGTTDEAGACLVLYSKNELSKPFISIVMGAETKPALYNTMESLISTIPGL